MGTGSSTPVMKAMPKEVEKVVEKTAEQVELAALSTLLSARSDNEKSSPSIHRIQVYLKDSVHNKRYFYRSKEPVSIRFFNTGITDNEGRDCGNMNVYGAKFDGGNPVVCWPDDDTVAEQFYVWTEESNDREFLLSPVNAPHLFVNINGGMLIDAPLMIYDKEGRPNVNHNTVVKMDANEFWYTEMVKEGDKWKYYIRSTPDINNKHGGYIKTNGQGESLKTCSDRPANNFTFVDMNNQDLGMIVNVIRDRPCDNNTLTIDGFGTIQFQESRYEFTICHGKIKNSLIGKTGYIRVQSNGFIGWAMGSDEPDTAKYKLLMDRYGRFIVRTLDNKYVDFQNNRVVDSPTKDCLIYFGFNDSKDSNSSTYGDKRILICHSGEVPYPAVAFVIANTCYVCEGEDYGMGSVNVADFKKFEERSIYYDLKKEITAKLDFGKPVERDAVGNYVPKEGDTYGYETNEDHSVPTQKFFKYDFKGKSYYVFDWYNWVKEATNVLSRQNDLPLLYTLYKFCETGIVDDNNCQYAGMSFVDDQELVKKLAADATPETEIAVNDQRAAVLGWNRYRDVGLASEAFSLMRKMSFIFQLIFAGLKHCKEDNEVEMLFQDAVKDLFYDINENKLLRHNLAGLTFFKLCEIFKVASESIKAVIPTMAGEKGNNLPYWEPNNTPWFTYADAKSDYCGYKTINHDLTEIVTDSLNPYILIDSESRHAFKASESTMTQLQKIHTTTVDPKTLDDTIKNTQEIYKEPTFKVDKMFSATPVIVGKRKHGRALKKDRAHSGILENIKINIEIIKISTGNGSKKNTIHTCHGGNSGNDSAYFYVPTLSIDQASWSKFLPSEWIGKLDAALAQNSIRINYYPNYGGCNDHTWSVNGHINNIDVNGQRVMSYSPGKWYTLGIPIGANGYHCNYCYDDCGDTTECGCGGRQHVNLNLNVNAMFDTLEQLCKDSNGNYSFKKNDFKHYYEYKKHFCNKNEFKVLGGLTTYHQNDGNTSFANHKIWMWCRVENNSTQMGWNGDDVLNEVTFNALCSQKNGSFTIQVTDEDDTANKTYCTTDESIDINKMSERDIINALQDKRMTEGLPGPADYETVAGIQCPMVMDVSTLRMFDARFDQVMINTFNDANNINCIVNKLVNELKSIMDNEGLKDKHKYASLAFNFMPRLPDRFSIESPIYPPAAIVDYSLIKPKGEYSVEDDYIVIGSNDQISINHKTNSNLEYIFKVVAEKFASDKLLVEKQVDTTLIKTRPNYIIVKLQTGVGHLQALFSEYDVNDSFVEVKGCSETDYGDYLNKDNSCVYLVFEVEKEDGTFSSSEEKSAANQLHLVTTQPLEFRVLEKTTNTFSFREMKFRLYYKDTSTSSSSTSSQAEGLVSTIQSDSNSNAIGLKYDYRLTRREGGIDFIEIGYLKKRKNMFLDMISEALEE